MASRFFNLDLKDFSYREASNLNCFGASQRDRLAAFPRRGCRYENKLEDRNSAPQGLDGDGLWLRRPLRMCCAQRSIEDKFDFATGG